MNEGEDADAVVVLYKITNTINGKGYIGLTRGSLARRWRAHKNRAKHSKRNSALHCAIRKYGEENFTVEEVTLAYSVREAAAIERGLISAHGTFSPNGYNLTTGGDVAPNFRKSAETRQKIRESRKSPAAVAAMARLHDHLRGKPLSEETRAKISAALTGKKLSDETRAKLSAVRTGKAKAPHSAEFKRRMKEDWETLRGHLRGVKRSPDVCKKISLGQIGKVSPLRGKKMTPVACHRIRLAKLAWWAARKGAINYNQADMFQ